MSLGDLPILSMLRTRLQWTQERQRVLAENVANADTPNYRGRDLKLPKFDEPARVSATLGPSVSLVRTETAHFAGAMAGGSGFESRADGNYEVSPTGNAINIEDEMMKVAANQMDYQAVTALYSRSLGLFKTALGKR